jgi:predicted enzyme related to lactoylglutathione lyase
MEALKNRVRGIGGIFYKSQNPEAAHAWYREHLGLNTDAYGTTFEWRDAQEPEKKGYTVWSPFKMETEYFAPSTQPFMINFVVDDLEALVPELKAEGVTVLDEIATYSYGKFVHILDLEGNKLELWEPIDAAYEEVAKDQTT